MDTNNQDMLIFAEKNDGSSLEGIAFRLPEGVGSYDTVCLPVRFL